MSAGHVWTPPAGVGRAELDRLVREAIDRSEIAVRVQRLEAVRRGVATVSTVAAITGSVTVTHGLTRAPAEVFCCSQNTAGAGLVTAGASSIGPATFDIQTRYGDGVARTLSILVAWIAYA